MYLTLSIKSNTLFISFVFIILKFSVLAYNLDVDNAKVFSIPKTFNYQRGSYFGYSVAIYTNGLDSILLVGAPRANTSTMQDAIEPGTVYQCPINKTCKEWIVKSGNGQYKWSSTINQIKDNAWIGATIAIENKTNPEVVVCGPRWKKNIIIQNRSIWFMNGICYLSLINDIKSFEKETESEILQFQNLEQTASVNGIQFYNFGMSQIGFSMHMISNELKWDLILGSPGTYIWRGSPLLVTRSIYGEIQTIIPAVKNERRIRENNYFGYAVTSGYFTKRELWFVSGAPRASNMYGSVILFTFPNYSKAKLDIKKSLIGEQYGEYFGAALTSCNLNGDSKDELIVGAPQWSKNVDEGRIYVFTVLHDKTFEKQSFEGKISGSRFGSTIACLGDIDYDGHGDIAVGAPYEEETGAIYIFNGNSNGLPKYYSQKIIGKQFGSNVRGFGISISEPRDINGDKYSDIAVGAYLSEQAIVIKSKPVIILTVELTHNGSIKLLKNSAYSLIDICIYYDGINAPKYLRIDKTLKIDQMHGRAYYGIEKNNYIYKVPDTLYKSEKICSQLKVNLKENIQNVIDPIEIFLSVSLQESLNLNDSDTKFNLSCTSCPVINKLLSKTEDLIKLPFVVECGDDNICTSDVRILFSTDLKSDNRYIIGSTFTTKLKIDAFNYGEPAYQAKIYIYIPKILSLASIPPSCMEHFYTNSVLEVICDLGNPLKKNKTLILDLDMSEVRFDIDHVKIWANFDTQSEQQNLFNNTHVITIYFDADIDIVIAGKAHDGLYSYFLEEGDKKLNNIQFQHIYEIQNFGISPVEEVILTISVPTYWKHSTGNVQIININQTVSYMDGQSFHCTYLNSITSSSTINKSKPYFVNTKLYTQEDFIMNTNTSINFPPENRSVYITCTNVNVKCTYIKCELGPFLSSSSIAKLSLMLDFHLFDFKSKMMEGKDIIFFLSSGSVNILESYNITQKIGHKPDSTIVATMFLGSPVTEQIAAWIIILSIVLGIFMLILLIVVLIKIGFFNRKKKELEALKFETSKRDGIILETCSSTEILVEE